MNVSNLLRGTQVRLTALTAEDLPTMARWYEDALFLRLYNADPAHPKAKDELGRWLEEQQKAKDNFSFAVRPLDSDDLIGYIELDEIIWPHGVCGMSFAIGDRADWGKGYGYEAVQLALAFAFDELNLHRVQVTVFSYNERSIALLEKLGLQREGVYREFLQRDSRRYDMYLYGLLRHEWGASEEAE